MLLLYKDLKRSDAGKDVPLLANIAIRRIRRITQSINGSGDRIWGGSAEAHVIGNN